MKNEIIERLERTAKECKTVQQFIDNVGWEDWMEDFLNEEGYPIEEGEPLDKTQTDVINDYLKKIWEENEINGEMTEEKMIRIMMADNCTKDEAIRHIKNGSVVFDNYDDYRQAEIEAGADEEEVPTAEDLKSLYFDGISGVEYNGKLYIVMYSL